MEEARICRTSDVGFPSRRMRGTRVSSSVKRQRRRSTPSAVWESTRKASRIRSSGLVCSLRKLNFAGKVGIVRDIAGGGNRGGGGKSGSACAAAVRARSDPRRGRASWIAARDWRSRASNSAGSAVTKWSFAGLKLTPADSGYVRADDSGNRGVGVTKEFGGGLRGDASVQQI